MSPLLEHSILPQALQSPPWQLQEAPGRSKGIDSARRYRPALRRGDAVGSSLFSFLQIVLVFGFNSPCFLDCEGSCWDELWQISTQKKHDIYGTHRRQQDSQKSPWFVDIFLF